MKDMVSSPLHDDDQNGVNVIFNSTVFAVIYAKRIPCALFYNIIYVHVISATYAASNLLVGMAIIRRKSQK